MTYQDTYERVRPYLIDVLAQNPSGLYYMDIHAFKTRPASFASQQEFDQILTDLIVEGTIATGDNGKLYLPDPPPVGLRTSAMLTNVRTIRSSVRTMITGRTPQSEEDHQILADLYTIYDLLDKYKKTGRKK